MIFGFFKVLDRNFALGNVLLPVVIQLLKQLPAPSVDHYVINSSLKTTASVSNINQLNLPTFTLSSLTGQLLECWLQSFFVIAFKVKYYQSVFKFFKPKF